MNEDMDEHQKTDQQTEATGTKLPGKMIEKSTKTIADMLNEVEHDDLPVQTQLDNNPPQKPQEEKPSYFEHHFSIHMKSSTLYLSTAPNQLNLFKTFTKCIKLIASQD